MSNDQNQKQAHQEESALFREHIHRLLVTAWNITQIDLDSLAIIVAQAKVNVKTAPPRERAQAERSLAEQERLIRAARRFREETHDLVEEKE